MPIVKGVLTDSGAVVRIEVGLSAGDVEAQRAALRPILQPVDLYALLDTGAEASCVDPEILASVGATLAGFDLVNLPATGGLTISCQYRVMLTVVHPSKKKYLDLVVPDLRVLEVPLSTLGYRALLGRDVLKRCRFVYDGMSGQFRLSYQLSPHNPQG